MTETNETTKRDLQIKTEDGVAPAWAYRPAGDAGQKALPAVLFYPDGMGVRPALHAMAAKLAAKGYFVLFPNVFYREGDFKPFDIATVWGDPEERARVMKMIHGLTLELSMRDARAYLDTIAAEANVRTDRVGVMGYCLGGRMAIATAGTHPGRIQAAASFHGGGLVTDAADSPHLLASKIEAALYIGVADDDGSCTPAHQGTLATALGDAHVEYQIELYKGKKHGFAVTDHAGAYDRAAGEQHWARVSTLFGEKLKG